MSHRTTGGLLIGSACVHLCTTMDLCGSGDVPVGVCPSSCLLHPRSQAKLDPSTCVQPPPAPCRAMGLPSPSPRWPLAPNSDPLHHQSSLSPLPPDSPCAKFKAWDQAAETQLKKQMLILHLSCPGVCLMSGFQKSSTLAAEASSKTSLLAIKMCGKNQPGWSPSHEGHTKASTLIACSLPQPRSFSLYNN